MEQIISATLKCRLNTNHQWMDQVKQALGF
jgi:hypothetical protein